jgi:hypothetical protein
MPPLHDVAAVRREPRWAWPSHRTSRAAGAGMALITAVSSIATQPSQQMPSAVIEEPFDLTESFLIARHVVWTVEQEKEEPFRELALSAVDRRPSVNDMCSSSSPPGVTFRVVPDDRDMVAPIPEQRSCRPVEIDLAEACAASCTGGATVLVEYEHHEGFAADSMTLFTVLNARTYSDRHGLLRLLGDPRAGEDQSAARITTGRMIYAFDVGPRNPSVELDAVLHVSAEALQEPLGGLHGWVWVYFWSVDVKSGFGSVQTLTFGTLDRYTPDSVVGGASVEIDWLGQCEQGKDCAIPVTLDVRTPTTGPSAPSLDAGTRQDYWRWQLAANLVALDGRTLPPDAIRIEGPFDPIIEP